MHVFTYGTLMFPEIWHLVVGREARTVAGVLAGYSIRRVRGATYPGIIAAAAECVVSGLVYLDVDAAALARLDCFEGDLYDRIGVVIECTDGVQRTAHAYVVPERRRHALAAESWSADTFKADGGLADFLVCFQGFSRLGGAE